MKMPEIETTQMMMAMMTMLTPPRPTMPTGAKTAA